MLTNIKSTTMALNAIILSHKVPILYRFKATQIIPTFHKINAIKIKKQDSCFKSFSPCVFQGKNFFSELGFSGNGLSCKNRFRVGSTSSGDGSGGYGGGSGGSGDGGGGDGGGGNKWSFLAWYLALLEAHPVLTKAITSALLTFVGDLICQVLIDKVPSLDLKRVSLFTILGLALVGPTLHFWYLYLSKLVTMTGASGAFVRLIIDQFIFAPVFIGVFLSTLVTLEGRPSQVLPKLQQEWLSSVVANWQLWIPFQFLNFRFVPQQFQVLAANFIALVWNVILSYKAHKEVVVK
ncbi:protein sym-1 [Rutidosis leptorrhynchoides]|uniref:protein sym-1 n=1 Tax=Rutidosis leptorrhynchoides TaxID=125765 RepID=UPI003A98E0A4